MKYFIETNFKNLNKKCQQELENDCKFKLLIKSQNLEEEEQQQQQQVMDYQEISPSSPVESQNPSFSSNLSKNIGFYLLIKLFRW